MRHHFRGALLVLLVGTAAIATPVAAQSVSEPIPESPSSHSVAELAAATSGAQGRVAINIAAGTGHQEVNSAVIAVGDVALGRGTIDQTLRTPGLRGGSGIASIADNAMANATGMIAVNVTAGRENQLANQAIVAIGIEAPTATEALLSQSRASQEPGGSAGETPAENYVADMSKTAFSGASGLVQTNLVGGERNSSSNSFTLMMMGESPQ